MSAIEHYVTDVYGDLFDRLPDQAGLAVWSAAPRAGTPRIAVANAITYSDEYRGTLIRRSYRDYLGREPDPLGLQNWLAAMGRGLTIQEMEAGFVTSPEYYAQAGGSDAEWVRRLYLNVLGRGAAPSEVASWVSATGRPGRRYGVAMGFLLSTEHLSTVIDGYYVDLLGRGSDAVSCRTSVQQTQLGVRVEAIIGGLSAIRSTSPAPDTSGNRWPDDLVDSADGHGHGRDVVHESGERHGVDPSPLGSGAEHAVRVELCPEPTGLDLVHDGLAIP